MHKPGSFLGASRWIYYDVSGQYPAEIELLQASFNGVQSSSLQVSDFQPAELQAQLPGTLSSLLGWGELCRIAERLLTPMESTQNTGNGPQLR